MRALRLALLLCFPLISFGQATPVVVADICPGGCSSNPSNLVEWNGKVYFFATSPTAGRELHVYDGTSVSVVADIAVGATDGIASSSVLTLHNNKLYFAANDTVGSTRRYLFSYDGNGLSQKVALSNGNSVLTSGQSGSAANALVIAFNDSANRFRLAAYSTATNTLQSFGYGSTTDVYQGAGPTRILCSGNYAFYQAQEYVGVSIKTHIINLNTGQILALTGHTLSTPKLHDNRIYFPYHVPQAGIFSYDFNAFTGGLLSQTSSPIPYHNATVGVFNSGIYYVGPASAPQSLYRYDPVAGTVTQLGSLPTRTPAPDNFFFSKNVNGILYVGYQSDAIGPELYGYSGGATILPITDVDGSSAGVNPTDLVSFNGDLLIAGTTPTSGTELYRIAGTGLGLTDAQEKSAAILSPNPATSQLTIKLPSSSSYYLRLLSATGQTLRSQEVQGSSTTVSVEDLATGLYFAQITDATTGASIGTARFVKE